MKLKEVLELAGATLASLGGGAAIIFGFSNWLGKVWANRIMTKEKAEYAKELESLRNRLTHDIESYKIKLKKSEFIFQKEFEAASEFVAMLRSFLPSYRHPDMCWNEACDEIAQDFEKIETALGAYLSKHGAVLQDEIKEIIGCCIGIAGENQFKVTSLGVTGEANKAADKLYKKLQVAEKYLLKQVHSQSST